MINYWGNTKGKVSIKNIFLLKADKATACIEKAGEKLFKKWFIIYSIFKVMMLAFCVT